MASFALSVKAQQDLCHRIGRSIDNLKKLGKEKITRETLDARLQMLEAHWSKFSTNHEYIFSKYSEEFGKLPYFTEDLFGDCEEVFVTSKAEMSRMRNELDTSTAVLNSTVIATNQSVSRSMPKISLPKFSGEYHEWLTFRDLFQSMVIAKTDISVVEKLHYLKSHVTGEALQLLSTFSVTEANFQRAWDALVTRYQNKRVLVGAYFDRLQELQPSFKSVDDLKRLLATAREVIAALKALDVSPEEAWDHFLVYFLAQRLDSETRQDWEVKQGNSSDLARFATLEEFLDGRIRALELVGSSARPRQLQARTSSLAPKLRQSARAHVSTSRWASCSCCRASHYISSCPVFASKTLQERRDFVQSKQLCFNCLGDHRVNQCRTHKRCRTCGEKHHTLLHSIRVSMPSANLQHDPSVIDNQMHTTSSRDRQAPPSTTSIVHSNCASSGSDSSRSTTLLATARVILETASGQKIAARALLDQGSELSFVCESLAQVLRLPRKQASIPVYGIGSQHAGSTRGVITVTIRSRFDSAVQCSVAVYVLPQLTGHIPATQVNELSWPHLHGLDLADPDFSIPSRVDLILGADIYGSLLRNSVRRGDQHAPVAQLTSLGWIISGPAIAPELRATNTLARRSLAASLDKDLHHLIERFWKQEEVPASTLPRRSPAEEDCETHFAKTHTRTSAGRYVVRLPFRASSQSLGESYSIAARLLQRTQGRIQRDATFGRLYSDFLLEYENLSHMVRVAATPSQARDIFYLPHHGVLRENSTTTKLRVVFNGSMKTSSGVSLNDCLHVGPKLQLDLADIILRWRHYAYVFIADIQKMFRQILVHPADRDYQRILWSSSGSPLEYQLCTVTYGLAPAPYLALKVIQQLAADEGARFPLAADILRQEMYVDDVLSGGDNVQVTQQKALQLRDLLMAGGFPLQKWTSNDSAVLQDVTQDSLNPSLPRAFDGDNLSRALGLSWNPTTDAFVFRFRSSGSLTVVTKRTVLSRISQVFDPLGWITPVTITAKIFMQQLWKLKCDWDSSLPRSLTDIWQAFEASLANVSAITIPRWLGTFTTNLAVELHGFSDASQDALGAVVYLRVYNELHSVRVTLLAAKSKVAPLAKQTVPRLELSAAVLLTRLVTRVLSVLKFELCPVHLWVDSSVVLSWLKGHPTQWKEFVANRVALIQEQLPRALWHHVAGVENPADCASRGLAPQLLVNHHLWWSGPTWLSQPSTSWPTHQPAPDENIDFEFRSTPVSASVATSRPVQWDLVERYSSLIKLLRITAWILRARDTFRKLNASRSASLSPAEITAAEMLWVKQTQQAYFDLEIKTLLRDSPLPRSHSLRRLAPFVDKDGLLRLGGRLKNSQLDPDAKHPILLPRLAPFSRLVIDDVHRRTLHGGPQVMLATLRQKFWILGGRTPVNAFVRRCVRCARYRATTAQEMMAQLPSSRVTPSRPFLNSGVDYAGPFALKTWRGRSTRTYKGFFVVFVCFATSAVHLELATDYSTQGFLAAYRRFISRRGICATLTSDCGSNLVGADAELKRLFCAASKEAQSLSHLLAADGTEWRFNPPAAPHFGGKWEAAVKSVKFHLRRLIGDAVLTYEEFNTLLTQIEAVLNSRPLCALSDDPSDVQALTPAHFLVGGPLSSLPDPSLDEVSTSRLSRWQLIQQLFDRFWRRWSAEYLQRLQDIGKWQCPSRQISVGSLVLLADERYPPSKWPLARVLETHAGTDGLVRVVTVKTSTSVFKRPIVKLCPLPIDAK